MLVVCATITIMISSMPLFSLYLSLSLLLRDTHELVSSRVFNHEWVLMGYLANRELQDAHDFPRYHRVTFSSTNMDGKASYQFSIEFNPKCVRNNRDDVESSGVTFLGYCGRATAISTLRLSLSASRRQSRSRGYYYCTMLAGKHTRTTSFEGSPPRASSVAVQYERTLGARHGPRDP